MNKVKVRYIGCSEDQKRFGLNTGDQNKLVVGQVYEIIKKETHNWHTKYWFKDQSGSFNSVCFINANDNMELI